MYRLSNYLPLFDRDNLEYSCIYIFIYLLQSPSSLLLKVPKIWKFNSNTTSIINLTYITIYLYY